ncbi:MAG: hypothetical protein WCO54_10830 [Bacteroidota bacterium]
MDVTNFWTWFFFETLGAIYVVGVLYYFFIRKYQKQKKQNAEQNKKDQTIP